MKKRSVHNINMTHEGKELPEGRSYVYYVDGYRRYLGTVRFHLFEDCHILQNTREDRRDSDTILKTDYPTSLLTHNICKYCFKRKNKDEIKKDKIRERMKKSFT